MAQKRKLIEVALPLEAINDASAHEKSVPRKGHPATLHLWWARRPLAAARAVLFAQLVDDPSSRPDLFPTEDKQRVERERLHALIAELVKWENIDNESLLSQARREIQTGIDGALPEIVDPFAGGGTIPLEAMRLGLKARASDLNPVAVLINKSLVELPAAFRDREPRFPGTACSEISDWKGSTGLAADVRAYGEWVRGEAVKRLATIYPKISGSTVIAWIWARTIRCPNPACRIEFPLVRSWWLGKKKGREAFVEQEVVNDPNAVGGRRVRFTIGHTQTGPTTPGTMAGKLGATCIACATSVSTEAIKVEGSAGRMGATLIAIVAEGKRRRDYYPPTEAHRSAAHIERPVDAPDQDLAFDPRNLWTPQYGLSRFADLFTNRQLVALCTFSDLVEDARLRVIEDGGEPEYAAAVATYLAFAVSKLADWSSSICGWIPVIEGVTHTFAKQAIPMTWDYAEINPLSSSVGNFSSHVEWVARSVDVAPTGGVGVAIQQDARDAQFVGRVISTDPPYYANIDYADLADFFYVWLRRSLRATYPELLGTLLTPKADELVANPYRHGGPDGAKRFFEEGFREVFRRARESASEEFPMTVYYAYREPVSRSAGKTSSGWETLLEGMVRGGWAITSTWPIRSEREARSVGQGTNALASSIVLSLRPRAASAPATDRPGFIGALKAELGAALNTLQAGGIAPVDLPQAAIGPGMAVFSRYSAVREFDGSQMSVRSALAQINEVLDEVLSEQEGDFDPATRFCIAWFRQHGYTEGKYGDAQLLGNARGIAVDTLKRHGVLHSAAGKVRLFRSSDLPDDYDVLEDEATSDWEGLHHLIRVLEADGVDAAGAFLARAASRTDGAVHPDMLPELAHLLFRVSEENRWTKEAISFNQLVTAWTDIHTASREAASARPAAVQQGFDFSS